MTGEGRFVVDGCIEVSRETVANMHRRDMGRFNSLLTHYDPLRKVYRVPADDCPRRLRSLAYVRGERDAQREFHWATWQKLAQWAIAEQRTSERPWRVSRT